MERDVGLPLRGGGGSGGAGALALGLDGLGPVLRDQVDGAALETVGLADLVAEILAVDGSEKVRVVDEEKERRRRFLHLRGVEELQPVPVRADGLLLLDRRLDRAVEDRGGDLLLEVGRHEAHRLQQAVQMKARFGGREDDGRVVEEEHLLLHPRGEVRERRHLFVGRAGNLFCEAPVDDLFTGLADGLFHQVPLVDHDDARLAELLDLAGDLLVLGRDARLGVHDEDGQVATLDRLVRSLHAVEFHRVADPRALPDAGGVDEQVTLADAVGLDVEGHVHRVARRSGDRADDDALRFGQGVDDRRFADVRPADDGDLERLVHFRPIFNGGLVGGKTEKHLGHELVDAHAVDGRDGENLVESEGRKLARAEVRAVVVHLVDGDEDRLVGGAEAVGHFLVQGHDPLLHVDDEDDHVGRLDGQTDLVDRGLLDHVLALLAAEQADAARVHERERPAKPFGFGGDTVPRHAGLVMDDGDAAARDAVEKGGFADIRATDDGDER